MKNLNLPDDYRLPSTPGAAARDALLQLAAAFGETDVFKFLGLLHSNESPLGEVRCILGGRAVLDALVRQPELTYQQARLSAGKTLGYEGTMLMNWNKIANRGRDILVEAGQWPVHQGSPADDTPTRPVTRNARSAVNR